MDPIDHILELLYDGRQRFVPQAELADATGLSPGRLDRALKALHGRGYRLQFAPVRGVRLASPIKLSAKLIERNLGTRRVGRSVLCFDEVDSTNDVAMDSARQSDTDGLVVLAEAQRRGRGRQGRLWLSERGANVLLSVLLLEGPQGSLSREALTIAAGLAVAEGIETICGVRAELKWPNDVLLDGEKVAGVLIETRPVPAGRAVVIGVGINVNASPPPESVSAPATDLAHRIGQPVERMDVIRAVLRRLDEWTAAAEARSPTPAGAAVAPAKELLDRMHRAWLARCGIINQRITVRCGRRRYVGRVLDVHPLNGLVLACDDGRRVDLPAEISTIE